MSFKRGVCKCFGLLIVLREDKMEVSCVLSSHDLAPMLALTLFQEFNSLTSLQQNVLSLIFQREARS
jgi:hypothetical protein